MVLAMVCISILGSLVWGHHIYTIGLEADTRSSYTGITIMISLPTGTITRNSPIPGYLYGTLILGMFTVGGSTGIVLGNAAMDVSLHDTYYVIAHFHSILSLGSMVSILVGVLYSQDTQGIPVVPVGSGYLGVYLYLGVCIGVVVTFLPLHYLGYNTQPRRILEYPDNYNCWSILSSLGSGTTVLSLLVIHPWSPQTPW